MEDYPEAQPKKSGSDCGHGLRSDLVKGNSFLLWVPVNSEMPKC